MKHEFDILVTLHEIRDLLKKQNELLEIQQTNPQTKITVVGNKATQTNANLNNTEDFFL
jgi:hypothetical protein